MARPRLMGWCLMLITLLVYLPVVRNGFLNFDDNDYVTENQMVQPGITWTGVKWALVSWHASNWHPLTWLSHMADCELFGLNPAGHHLVNLLFHAANAGLLFLLWLRLTHALWPSAIIAALFAWHPLHVESVAWIAERKDVLSTFFALLALSSYVRHVQDATRGPGWLALLFFGLGLMCKPMLVTLPFVLLLLDFWPLQRNQLLWRLGVEKWPFFLLAAASCVVTVIAQRAEAIAPLAKYSLGVRFENVVTAYVRYLYKAIWPTKLAVFYPLIPPAWPAVVLSAGVLAAVSLWVWRAKSQPYLLVGWLWFLGTLVPVIGWVQVGDQALADRYTYFPLIGIFFAGVWLMNDWAQGFHWSSRWLTAAAGLTLAACVGVTEHQLSFWRNSETLFCHALAVTPDNAPARLNLGEALQEENRPTEALAEYFKALRMDPHRPEIYHNIGRLLSDEGRPGEALKYCRQAVALNGRSPLSHDGLGVVLAELGRYPEALLEFSEATRLDPGSAAPHFQAGRVLLKQGLEVEAVTQFHTALRLDPDNVKMLIYTARVLAASQNPSARDGPEAVVLAQRAAQLAGGQSVVLDTLAMACAQTGHFEEAIQLARQAMVAAHGLGNQDDFTNIQQRLELYQQHQPARLSRLQP